jgi:enamine deaminase RidA (YjgF/YER057c/UK114 family)
VGCEADAVIQRIESSSPYAPTIGFSKAVRAGDLVFVAGMSAIDAAGDAVGRSDPYLQAKECLRKAAGALGECGVTAADVVQTRIYLVDPSHWEQVGRAHAEAFGAHRPAATMVVVKELLDPRMLVEIELLASDSSQRSRPS